MRRLSGRSYSRSSRSTSALSKLFVVATFSSCLLSSPRLNAQEPEVADRPRVEEEITISESALIVDFGEGMTASQLARISAAQVQLFEEGVLREVVDLTPVLHARSESWRLVVWLDAPTTSTETVRRVSAALGGVATAMTQLGSVEIVVADPRPETRLKSRSAVRLQDEFAALVREPPGGDALRYLRRESSGRSVEARRSDLATEVGIVRRQADQLLEFLGSSCAASACGLVLVSDGFDLSPASHYLGDAATDADRALGRETELAAIELAEALASLQWVTLVPAFVEQSRPTEKAIASPDTGFQTWARDRGSYFDGIRIPLGRRTGGRSRDPAAPVRNLGALVSPWLEPLRQIADETSGLVIRNTQTPGRDGQISALIDGLQALALRYRVRYRTDRPLDGQVRTLEARLSNGREVTVPRWVEGSTPHGIASARARQLLAGEGGVGELAVRVRAEEPGELRVAVDWGDDSPVVVSGLPGALRVTVARRLERRPPQIAHRVAEVASPGTETGDLVVSIDPAWFGSELAVVVEELRFRVWGASSLAP